MNKYSRQQDLVDSKIFKTPITVVGVGGIGSFTVLTLAKMGFKDITVFDPDTVEEYNLPNQFYRSGDIGKHKVDALHILIRDFEGLLIKSRYTRIENSNYHVPLKRGIGNIRSVFISAVDSIETREVLFDMVEDVGVLYIDGRMGQHQAEVYTINTAKPKEVKLYQKTLWSNDQVEPLKCTEKAIIYNVVFIASVICNQIKLALEGKIYSPQIRADLENFNIVKKGV